MRPIKLIIIMILEMSIKKSQPFMIYIDNGIVLCKSSCFYIIANKNNMYLHINIHFILH